MLKIVVLSALNYPIYDYFPFKWLLSFWKIFYDLLIVLVHRVTNFVYLFKSQNALD